MRRIELKADIADLTKRQAIKKSQLDRIERSTNWQHELYLGTQDELFELTEKLDKKMDEYYYVAKNEVVAIDEEYSKLQDCLMADPFDYDALTTAMKDAKGRRLEILGEMQSVLWSNSSINTPKRNILNQDEHDELTEEIREEAHNG